MELQKQVQKRLEDIDRARDMDNALAATPGAKGKWSGRAKTLSDVITHEVEWPHYYVARANAPVMYDELTPAEFTAGTIDSII